MLDAQTLSYMEAARTALGLALCLDRVRRGDVRPRDIDSLRNAAEYLSKLGSLPAANPETTLFASPEGLGVMIHAAEETPGFELESVDDRLHGLIKKLIQPPVPDSALESEANDLHTFFMKIHDIAKEIVAFGADSAPTSELDRALANR